MKSRKISETNSFLSWYFDRPPYWQWGYHSRRMRKKRLLLGCGLILCILINAFLKGLIHEEELWMATVLISFCILILVFVANIEAFGPPRGSIHNVDIETWESTPVFIKGKKYTRVNGVYSKSGIKAEYYQLGIKWHGRCTRWYPTGQKKFEGYFRDDMAHGIRKTWYPDGRLDSIREFNLGKEIFK